MTTQTTSDAISAAVADATARYIEANPLSHRQHGAAAEVLPGGNTRSVLFSAPFPITLTHAEGCYVTSLDGRRYTDFLGEYTAGLYGHSHPVLRQAAQRALEGGWVMGGHIRAEEELARLICERFPSIDLVRFANSGTEANLYAMSAARAISGKPKIVVFEGGYHGGVFVFAGPSALRAPFEFVIAPYNDVDGTRALLDQHRHEIACVVVEPMQGSGGCIQADRAFLRMLRDWTSDNDSLLVFDEVMTSRLSPGGLQEAHGINPDLTTLGKYIGGGFSFGAFGGRADLMRHFNPLLPGSFGHAGTFNNNVFTMMTGAAGLREVYTPAVVREFNARGDALRERLNGAAAKARFPMQFIGRGSMMNVHMRRGPIRSTRDLTDSLQAMRELFYFDMLEQGIWLARRGMVNMSLALTDADCDGLVSAVENFVDKRNALA